MCNKNEVVKYSSSSNTDYRDNNGLLMFLYLLLNFTLVIGIFCLIGIPGFLIGKFEGVTIKFIIFAELDCIIALLIVYELKNIVDKIMDCKVFIIDNVKSFNKVGFYTLVLGIANMINDVMSGNLKVMFAFDKYGNLKIDIFVFIMLSCIFLVIAEVLKKAIKIKNENDLTI